MWDTFISTRVLFFLWSRIVRGSFFRRGTNWAFLWKDIFFVLSVIKQWGEGKVYDFGWRCFVILQGSGSFKIEKIQIIKLHGPILGFFLVWFANTPFNIFDYLLYTFCYKYYLQYIRHIQNYINNNNFSFVVPYLKTTDVYP